MIIEDPCIVPVVRRNAKNAALDGPGFPERYEVTF